MRPSWENLTLIESDYLSKNLASGITYITLMSLFMLTGTCGNVLVVCAIFVSKKLRTMGNMFIVNLALADLCVTGIVDPFSIIGVVEGEAYFIVRPVLCEIVASICLTSCFCSLLSIGAISVNRYIHICHHRHYNAIFTRYKTMLITIGLWVASFLLQMGCFIGWGDHVYDKKTMSCIYDRTADYSYTLFFCIFGVGSPLIIIAICYVHIYVFVWQSKKKVRDRSSIANRPKSSDMKFVGTILTIVIIFVICWTPYVTVTLYDHRDVLSPTLHTYVVLVAHINSSLNSVLYGISNRQFRIAYMKVIRMFDVRQWCRKQEDRDASIEVSVLSDTHMNTINMTTFSHTENNYLSPRSAQLMR